MVKIYNFKSEDLPLKKYSDILIAVCIVILVLWVGNSLWPTWTKLLPTAYTKLLLDAFAKLRKATICFVMSVRPPVRVEKLGSSWTVCQCIWYLGIFPKSTDKIQASLKSNKDNRSFTPRPLHRYDNISFSYLRMRNVIDKIIEKIKTHILFPITFRKSCRLWNMWKNLVEPGRPQMTWGIRIA